VTLPVLPLPVTVIEPSLETLLVAAIGRPPLLPASVLTADEAAIALPAIAVGAKEEHRAAFDGIAEPLPQKYFAVRRHTCPQAALDNGNGSVAG
jgi:hypothetical protein